MLKVFWFIGFVVILSLINRKERERSYFHVWISGPMVGGPLARYDGTVYRIRDTQFRSVGSDL